MGARAVIVAGERVALTAPERDEFVERWQVFNDPLLASLLGSPTFAHGRAARTMPPVTREQREALYERHVARSILCFDVRLTDADRRCVGEGYLSELSWPRASAELSVAIFSPDDRGKRYGSEGAVLLCAYALDGLGVNRLSLRFTGRQRSRGRGDRARRPGRGRAQGGGGASGGVGVRPARGRGRVGGAAVRLPAAPGHRAAPHAAGRPRAVGLTPARAGRPGGVDRLAASMLPSQNGFAMEVRECR